MTWLMVILCFETILLCMYTGVLGSVTLRLKRIEERQQIREDRQRIMEDRLRIMESTNSLERTHRREDTEIILMKMTDIEIMLNKSQNLAFYNIDKETSTKREKSVIEIEKLRPSGNSETEKLLKAFGDEKRLNQRMRRRVQSLESQIKHNAANNDAISVLLNVSVPEISKQNQNILFILNGMKQEVGICNIKNDKVLDNTDQIMDTIYNSSKLMSLFENQMNKCFLNTTETVKTDGYANISENLNKTKTRPTSCLDSFTKGVKLSGIYTIYPSSEDDPIQVYCDQETDGGGWTVFQRRQDGSVDFYRNWTEYESGFGELGGEFWLGNEILNRLTVASTHELRIELDNIEDKSRSFAKYSTFKVGSDQDDYALTITGFSGDVTDNLKYHNGMKFSTTDRDTTGCAVEYKGAWWFNSCYHSHLNGQYKGRKYQCICWSSSCPKCYKYVEMKLR